MKNTTQTNEQYLLNLLRLNKVAFHDNAKNSLVFNCSASNFVKSKPKEFNKYFIPKSLSGNFNDKTCINVTYHLAIDKNNNVCLLDEHYSFTELKLYEFHKELNENDNVILVYYCIDDVKSSEAINLYKMLNKDDTKRDISHMFMKLKDDIMNIEHKYYRL